MIPKIIHYCWFGKKPLTDEVKAYIETWKRHFPDFEIKRWDESNFDVNAMPYTRQAYFAKRFAFVSDVARLAALYSDGGIYLDTDILIKKRFPDEWFRLDGFGSFEHDKYVQTGVIASAPGHPIIKEFLDSYVSRKFFKGFHYDIVTNVAYFTKIMEDRGFVMNNKSQIIDGFRIFPQQLLCANDWVKGRYDDDTTFAVHDFQGSWGKDALKSMLKFKFAAFMTIMRWHLRPVQKDK